MGGGNAPNKGNKEKGKGKNQSKSKPPSDTGTGKAASKAGPSAPPVPKQGGSKPFHRRTKNQGNAYITHHQQGESEERTACTFIPTKDLPHRVVFLGGWCANCQNLRMKVSGSTPTPWSGPFRDHGLNPPPSAENPRNKRGLERPFLDLVSQTPRPRGRVDPCLLKERGKIRTTLVELRFANANNFHWMQLFCLQLEASCLQCSFFTYTILQLTVSAFLLRVGAL